MFINLYQQSHWLEDQRQWHLIRSFFNLQILCLSSIFHSILFNYFHYNLFYIFFQILDFVSFIYSQIHLLRFQIAKWFMHFFFVVLSFYLVFIFILLDSEFLLHFLIIQFSFQMLNFMKIFSKCFQNNLFDYDFR